MFGRVAEVVAAITAIAAGAATASADGTLSTFIYLCIYIFIY